MSELQISPLFQGLARPAMVGGVTLPFLLVNAFAHLILFVVSSSFIWFISFGVIYGFGRVLCYIDPNIFNIILGFLEHMLTTRRYGAFKGNCYEPC